MSGFSTVGFTAVGIGLKATPASRGLYDCSAMLLIDGNSTELTDAAYTGFVETGSSSW